MTPGSGRHRAADDPDDPTSPLPRFVAVTPHYGPPPPFVAPVVPGQGQPQYQPPPPFMPPSEHPPLLERAFQRDSAPPLEYASQPAPPVQAPEPVFIPLRPPRRSHRRVGTAGAALLAVAVVLGGGYVLLTRSSADGTNGSAAVPPLTISLPSATPSTSPVAKAKAKAKPKSTPTAKAPVVHLPVKYRSPKGHFAARFAHQPATETDTATIGGHRISIYRVIDVRANALAEGAAFPSVPPSRYDAVLDGSIDGLRGAVSTMGTVTVSSATTTFRHHPARRFTVTVPDGTSLTGIVTMFSGTHFYVLMAPSGAPFTALTKSFAILP